MQEPTQIPPAPRAPSDTARALLFQFRAVRLVWLIIGVLWCTAGWGVPGLFARGIPSDLLLSLASTKTTGTITDVRESDGLPINRVYPHTIFYKYTFNGEPLEGFSKTFDEEGAKRLAAGQSIEIELLASHPSLSRAVDTKLSQYGLLGFFTIAFPLFGLVLVFVVLGQRRKDLSAYTYGTAASAKRLSGQKRGDSISLRWEFDAGGRLYFGECTTKAHPSLEPFLTAETLPVLYNPADPRDNSLYIA